MSIILGIEIVIVIRFLKLNQIKKKKIVNLDTFEPDDKTYCVLTLKIYQVMWFQLIISALKFLLMILCFESQEYYGSWYYSDKPDIENNNEVKFFHPNL